MECQICGKKAPDAKVEEEIFTSFKGQQKSINLCNDCATKARRNDPEAMRGLLPFLKD